VDSEREAGKDYTEECKETVREEHFAGLCWLLQHLICF
jgi:hypothetical protein